MSSPVRRAWSAVFRSIVLPTGLLLSSGIGNHALSAGANSSGQQWGPDAVWHGPAPSHCAAGHYGPACLAAAMAAGGARPEAIAFARAEGFQEYLSDFRPFGPVDLGIVTVPFVAGTPEWPVLLDGVPAVVNVARIAYQLDLRANPDLAALLARDRMLGMSALPPDFASEGALPGGGQRFLFRATISRCVACRAVAKPELTYDFDSDGRFLGARLIEAGIVAPPPGAGACKVSLPQAAPEQRAGEPPPFRMTMSSRERSCWEDIWTRIRGGPQFGAAMHLLHRPIHGQVAIIVMRSATRVEYRPNRGFVGNDIFSVVNEPLGTVRVFFVSVTR